MRHPFTFLIYAVAMKIALLSLAVMLTPLAASAKDGWAEIRLCGRTGIVHQGTIAPGGFHETWTWDVSKAPGVPAEFVPKLQQIDDCKRSRDGKEMLISSSKGAVAIVGYPQGDVRFWAAVPNAHSIELLPNGVVAAASSTFKDGNMLMLFDRRMPDKPLWTMPAEAAHGVTWDSKRNVLWALRHTELLKLAVKREGDGVAVNVLKAYSWGGNGGHDLVLMPGGNRLVCTTSSKVMVFDIEHETFTRFEDLSGLKDVKSVSFEGRASAMAYTVADSTEHWWTNTVHIRPMGGKDFAVKLPFEAYKTRWVEASF